MLKVGYIGLGLMGKSIARNILKAGFPLVVHNRSRAAVEELAAEGAIPAGSPAEVAGQVDVVFTNLPDSPDVERVALGKDGIIEGAHSGLIFVDNSTIKPVTARHIARVLGAQGVQCLDAPVSGGDIGARNATLVIMVGGPAEALERVNLGAFARRRVTELSGGEQQRVAIARAVVNRPSIVLADEPTGSLDSLNSGKVLQMLRDLNDKLGQTIVMITHDCDAASTASRVIEMKDGQILSPNQPFHLSHSLREAAENQ